MNDTNINTLSTWFLGLVAIVIGAMIFKMNPSNMSVMMPTFVLIALVLWIVYDYILTDRYYKALSCVKEKHNREMIRLIAANEANQIQSDVAVDDSPVATPTDPPVAIPTDPPVAIPTDPPSDTKQTHAKNEHYEPLETMLTGFETNGDTALCNRMKYGGAQAQMSQIIRSRHNKYKLLPYFEEELRQHEDREWWNSDHLDGEMIKDGQAW
jgi:hypothetical protein